MDLVIDYINRNYDRFVNELCDYVRFPSVSAQKEHRDDTAKCAEWIANHLKGIGLDVEVYKTDNHPIVVAKTKRRKSKPHIVIYGHYDVQPPEPFELWASPPFYPRIVDNKLYARGASDNKGQHFAHIKAVEAYIKSGCELPCDVTFLIEGEEEIGSAELLKFLKSHKELLRCDAVVASDTGIPGIDYPALTYALRGVAALEIYVYGPLRDLHSGIYGGAVDNPAMVLCQILAQLRDKNGRIKIPGFYDNVRRLTKLEREYLSKIPFNEKEFKEFLGVPQLFGEKGYSPIEQRTARPTIEINGLTSGYQGEGSKTIIPSTASAKLTFRLVPDQNKEDILEIVCKHIKKICPPTVRLELVKGHSGDPYILDPTSSLCVATLAALKKAFNREPLLLREGGSIPIVTDIKKILGVDTILVGLALPDDNAHSPNEKFDLRCFQTGMKMSAILLDELSAALNRDKR
ncbi:MAG: dipeptidase [Limisphaerales bacterium]|jgi:acetylornithine deacetylase/succinyl-diaminopimelate desuccinylase-like protein